MEMTHVCQLTEIPTKGFPELFRFYQYFPEKYPFLLSTTSHKRSSQKKSNQKKGIQQESDKDSKKKPTTSFDILFIEPGEWLKLDHTFTLTTSSQVNITNDNSFLNAFDQIFLAEKVQKKKHSQAPFENQPNLQQHELPFTGGWFMFLAYELAQQIEPCLNLPSQEQQLPVAFASRVKCALIYDHFQEKLFFVSESGTDHKNAYQTLLYDSQEILQASHNRPGINDLIKSLNEEDEEAFLKSVEVIRDYITEGDVFQVNLSRLWQSSMTYAYHTDLAASLYELLSIANPAPFSGIATFFKQPEIKQQGSEQQATAMATIISSSPERLLKIQDNQLESRPIAGTRPRSLFEHEDLRLMDELHAHPKEQAEHIMLIDLIRNDLGRVCVPGTVKVDELMVNESYAHVHHIVSNVSGQLQHNTTPGDAIKALFPGGTITGCPKIRCMEIIAEMEQKPRGAYTGSMGYINLDGSMDLNILIRTMVLEEKVLEEKVLEQGVSDQGHLKQQKLTFRAGAGLVFDSIAEKELQETRAKAKGLLRVLSGQQTEQVLYDPDQW